MIQISTYVTMNDMSMPLAEAQGIFADPDYANGFIELTVDGRKIITHAEWDLVDQLWAYIVNGACEIARRHSFSTRFPDQPIELLFAFDPAADAVVIELRYPGVGRPAKATVGRREFIDAIASAAEPVFRKFIELAPGNRDGYELVLHQIEGLKHIED